jgi:hypothetical protein
MSGTLHLRFGVTEADLSKHDEERLIRELYANAQQSGNKTLEVRLADLCLWYHKNMGDIPLDNLASRQTFLQKAMWILLEVCALQTERIHQLEGAKNGALWTPRGVAIEGDLRRFG